jgi:hypothetical protein
MFLDSSLIEAFAFDGPSRSLSALENVFLVDLKEDLMAESLENEKGSAER